MSSKRNDILISLTTCPECGGTRWQRWAYVWPLGNPEDATWMRVDPWGIIPTGWRIWPGW